jgi:hypothetical protein
MFDADRARELAQIRRPCPWCGRVLRPCNLPKHIELEHYHQLTIDEVLDEIERQGRVWAS